jgi:hypothetical protein
VRTDVPREVLDGMQAIAFATIRGGAGRHTPRPRGTGRLFASLFQDAPAPLTRRAGHDLDRAPHAQWVIGGSVPHAIPKLRGPNQKMLRWFGPTGLPIFARSVWHPGYIGDNYIQSALNDTLRQFSAIVDRALSGVP